MTLQFVLGKAHDQKDEWLLDDIAQRLSQPGTDRIYYLVPDHMKFEAEMKVLEDLHDLPPFKDRPFMGMIRLQVFSIQRLAWYLLQDQPLFQLPQLTDTGKTLVLKKIFQDQGDQLKIYQKQQHQPGFYDYLLNLFTEFRKGLILPEDLKDLLSRMEAEGDLSREVANLTLKLQDIHLIYQDFYDRLGGRFIEMEDVIQALIDHVQGKDWSGQSFVFNNFNELNAQEVRLIEVLLENGADVTVGLTLDRPHPNAWPEGTDLFYPTAKIYHRLFQMALDRGFDIKTHQVEAKKEGLSQSQQAVERFWRETSALTNTYSQGTDTFDQLELWSSENRQAEVEHTALKIRTLVKAGVRFKDIQVLTRDLAAYETIIEPVFDKHEIPVFISQSKKMSGHPLVQMLKNLLLIDKRNWRLDHVLGFLKSGLFLDPLEDLTYSKKEKEEARIQRFQKLQRDFRKDVDITENVALAYGYQGADWTQEEDWYYGRFDDLEEGDFSKEDLHFMERSNVIRRLMRDRLQPFFQRLHQANTNAEAARALYLFLEDMKVPDILLTWRDVDQAKGRLEDGRDHEQVWQEWVQLLDEFVRVLGDDPFRLDDFIQLLDTGFESAVFSSVPQTLDQVQVLPLDQNTADRPKYVFILGFLENQLPKTPKNQSLLSEEDRDLLNAQLEDQQVLSRGPEEDTSAEPFIAYEALTRAKEGTILSFPAKNADNEELKASPYLTRFEENLGLPLVRKLWEPDFKDDQALEWVGSERSTLGQVLSVIRQSLAQEEEPAAFWLDLYRYFKKRAYSEDRIRRPISGLTYQNIPAQLSPDTVQGLYTDQLYLSVSQIEAYYRDPYSHFLQYGLKLRERKRQELSPLERGNYFHAALDLLFKRVNEEGKTLIDYTDTEREQIVEEVMDQVNGRREFKILSSNHNMAYTRYLLNQTIQKMALIISWQTEDFPFRTKASEVGFGLGQGPNSYQGFSHSYEDGRGLHLRGKIDRIGDLTVGDQAYLGVVDYKSSDQKFNYSQVYYGLDLQLLTYLLTALANQKDQGKNPRPLGAFYLRVHDTYKSSDHYMDEAALKHKDMDDHKMNGFLVVDEDLHDYLDEILVTSQSSKTIRSLSKTKNGVKYGNKGSEIAMTPEEFSLLADFVKGRIIQAGADIFSGKISLHPIEVKGEKNYTPSVQLPYKAVSQFDAMLPENNYRFTYPKDLSDLIEKGNDDSDD